MSEAPSSGVSSQSGADRKGSDLSVRLIAGLVMIAVALLGLYLGGWPFLLLVIAPTVLMMIEWTDMHGLARKWGYAASICLALLLLLLGMRETELVLPAILAAIGLAIILGLMARSGSVSGGFLYLALPSIALVSLRESSLAITLWLMVVTWSTDIFAYVAGRSIGGPKLAPTISPNKTWAGLIGGMAGAAVLGALLANWLDLPYHLTRLGAPMGLLAQGGDLYESWVKRRAGVKDSGTLLPGHGGVLDRLDGLLPVVVATFLLVMLGVITP